MRADDTRAIIWKKLLIDAKKFRRFNAPGLTKKGHLGAEHQDGIVIAMGETAAPTLLRWQLA